MKKFDSKKELNNFISVIESVPEGGNTFLIDAVSGKWIDKKNNESFDFGVIFSEVINAILSLRSADAFINYERMKRSAHSVRFTKDNTAYIMPYYFLCLTKKYKNSKIFDLSYNSADTELLDLYNDIAWIYSMFGDKITETINFLNEFLQKDRAARQKYFASSYRYFLYLCLSIGSVLFLSSFNNNSFASAPAEELKVFIAEAYNSILKIENESGIAALLKNIQYSGFETCLIDKAVHILPGYYVRNIYLLACEDFAHFTTSESSADYRICNCCGSVYSNAHKHSKYCPLCFKNNLVSKRRTADRKNNPVSYLNKLICDQINNVGTAYKNYGKNTSRFLAESHFYKAVVKGQKPKTKKLPDYDSNITTEEAYIEWLKEMHVKVKTTK